MRRWAALALLLAGCQPALGTGYACDPESPLCPPGWACWEDGVCRDHMWHYEAFEACPAADDVEDEMEGLSTIANENCSTRLCATGVDPMAESDGAYCSRSCDDDDDCSDLAVAPGAICVAGACRKVCQRRMDCPEGSQCWYGIADPMRPPPAAYCFALQRNDLNGTRSCTGNMPTSASPCQLPGWCLLPVDGPGVCSMLCETNRAGMPEQCPMDSACVQVMNDIGQCLRPCTSAGDCSDPNLECLPAADGSFCMPSAWSGAIPSASNFRMMPPPGG